MSKIDQHPNAMLNEAISAIIRVEVGKELQRRGVVTAAPGPKELRIASRQRMSDVAAKAGVSKSTISRIESGKAKRPSPEAMDKIARAIGCGETVYSEAVSQLLAQVRVSC